MNKFLLSPRLPLVLGLSLLSGCVSNLYQTGPDLDQIYGRSARHAELDRNPIIVIPGILGSRLRDSETQMTVWGAFGLNAANPEKPDGARLVALPMRPKASLAELRDSVQADGVLDRIRVRLFGLPVEQQAYFHLLSALGAGGYRDQDLGELGLVDYGEDHFTCFQFAYDWRRDNVENARRLHEFILQKRSELRAEFKTRYGIDKPDIKFDIVAHSMGGLLTRYYLRYGDADLPQAGSEPDITWAGTEYVENVVLVGTPNAGSVDALKTLVEGSDFAFLLPDYTPAVLGTFPAMYQLMPRSRHQRVLAGGEPVDIYYANTWERFGWGLMNPAESPRLAMLLPNESAAQRKAIAREHLGKSLQRAQRFHQALDKPAKPPDDVILHLVAGDSNPPRPSCRWLRMAG